MKSKAAIIVGKNEPLEFVDLDIPKLKVGQVLVEIFYTSICGSQINEIRGDVAAKFIPHTSGHEGYGRVIDSGDSKHFQNDDKVIISWIKDKLLRESEPIKYGNVNSGKCSTFMKYAVVSENRLSLTDIEDNFNIAPFLGCAIPTAMNAVWKRKGDTLLLGLGGVGACAAAFLQNYLIEDDDGKFYGEDLDKNKVEKSGLKQYNGEKVDTIIDFTGNDKAFYEFWPGLKGKYIIAGNYNTKFSIDPMDFIFDRQIEGVRGDQRDLRSVFCKIGPSENLHKFNSAVGRTYFFDEINIAIDNFGRELKPVIVI